MSRFPTTSWSMVVGARGHPAVEARDALTALCQAYWYPIYEYVRHRGYAAQDAQDLTQEAFIKALGLGLSYPLDAFDVTIDPDAPARITRIEERIDGVANWAMQAFTPYPSYIAAVAYHQ